MKRALPGIGGTLFPSRYLSDRLASDARIPADGRNLEQRRRGLIAWWQHVEATCGPATGLRALFDLVCMPLFGTLGYRARDAQWHPGRAEARLHTAGGASVGLVLLPWTARVPGLWRDLAVAASANGDHWGFVVAPPYVSLLRLRGVAARRAVDFKLPDVLDRRSFAAFWTVVRAAALDGASSPQGLAALVQSGARFQDRVREDLQLGVETALGEIARALETRARRPASDEALTIVYRVLFLLFAEARDLVPRDHPIYRNGYSVVTLVREALGEHHSRGVWDALAAITRISREGCRTDDLIVHPFNGRLFARGAAPSLEAPARTNRRTTADACDQAVHRALVALGSRPGPGGREEIAYADLGVEQLGAVYERVLDLPMTPSPGTGTPIRKAGRPPLRRTASSSHSRRRKETGTFYTPQPLAELVVRRTLAPLVEGQPPDAILALRVVDPAMGSGAFLVAACRYLAGAYERALIAAGDASAADLDDREQARVRRMVAERCLAGVDLNPVAVQVARLSLWLATLADGCPLTFLDHRLRVGNSLIGARPDDLVRCGPSRRVGGRPQPLFDTLHLDHSIRQAVRPLIDLVGRSADTLEEARAKERTWDSLEAPTSPLAPWRKASDAWCARWCGPTAASRWSAQEMAALIASVLRHDPTLRPDLVAHRLAEADTIARTHRFFHWPLEFSDAFYEPTGLPRDRPGFDAVIGNPPWEMIRRDAGKDAAGAHDALAAFLRDSGVYALRGRGHVNVYQPFVERALMLCRDSGRIGMVLPWGAAVDDGAAPLRRRVVEGGLLDTIVGFDNAAALFPIHRGVRFAVVICDRRASGREIRARFGVRTHEEVEALTGEGIAGDEPTAWPVRLSAATLRTIGGATLRVPDAREPDHLNLVARWTETLPRLGDERGWRAQFGRELNASDDRDSFGSRGLPVLEGKDLEPFRVRTTVPRHHIRPEDAHRLLPDARFDRRRLGYRDVSSVSNTRSLIAAVIPAGRVTTHTIYCLRTPLEPVQIDFLCGVLNSFVLNMIVRLLMGGHVTTSLVEELPVPKWDGTLQQRRIARLARRLTGRGPDERLWPRLEAEVAAMYGLGTDSFRSLVETFPLVSKAFRDRSVETLRHLSG